jgi:hypothetical protein
VVTTVVTQGNCKVQYLHQTVRDFLDNTKTEALLNMSRPLFSSRKSLLACDIMRIKRCFQGPISNNDRTGILWSRVLIRIMELAHSMEQSAGQSETELLDELDRTISSQRGTLPHPQCNYFLEFATVYGLENFLSIKLNKNTVSRDSKSGPLYLYLALCFPWKLRSPNFETVSLLLTLGADPNEMRGKWTVWQQYLSYIASRSSQADSGHLSIVEQLVHHGADTTASCKPSPDSSVDEPVADVIRHAFPHSTLSKRLELIASNQAEIPESLPSSSRLSLGAKWVRKHSGEGRSNTWRCAGLAGWALVI